MNHTISVNATNSTVCMNISISVIYCCPPGNFLKQLIAQLTVQRLLAKILNLLSSFSHRS